MSNSSLALITAWQQGDEQAAHMMFSTYYPKAVRLGVYSGLEPEAAQDCAQEAIVLAFERRRQLRDPKAFELWFHRIITRRILTLLKERKRRKEFSLESELLLENDFNEDWERDQMPQPDDIVIAAQEHRYVWEQIQHLPTDYRVPLALRYYSDFSISEVAELIGKREGTVRVLIHRALQQLRTLLEEQPTEKKSLSRSAENSTSYGG